MQTTRLRSNPAAAFLQYLVLTLGIWLLGSPAFGQVVTDIVNFHQGNGSFPNGILVQGRNGNFYGTTALGGTGNFGTVFEMTTQGKLLTLHNFTYYDGYLPIGMILGKDGNFYGVATAGGPNGYGTIFKMTPTGAFTLLYTFSTHLNDGPGTPNNLVQGTDGNFYGTTQLGGVYGYGTAFRITPEGFFTIIYSFTDVSVVEPKSLILGTDGNFYGVSLGNDYHGAFFKLTPSGIFSTLYIFGTVDGWDPNPITLGNDGTFYGTTVGGGTDDFGTVYKMTPDGTLKPV
jgi:uncharacterized repeat protein (TIGR03803 family)